MNMNISVIRHFSYIHEVYPRLFVVVCLHIYYFDAIGAMECLVVPIRALIIRVISLSGSLWRSFW